MGNRCLCEGEAQDLIQAFAHTRTVGMPLGIAPGPPGPIRERFAGRNLRTGKTAGGWSPLLRRGRNRMTLSRRGSANLLRSGLRPNGPSNTASRHRHLAGENGDRRDRVMHPRKSQKPTTHLPAKAKTSELGRSIRISSFPSRLSAGKRLQSNRRVGG